MTRAELVADQPSDATGELLVVVPCLNELRNIEATIRWLLAEAADRPTKIVIVDGGSTDGTPEILRQLAVEEPAIEVIGNPQRIQAAGVNLAVFRYAKDHEFFVRVDVHCEYPRGFISALLADARRTAADSVVVSMRAIGERRFQCAVAAAQNSVLGNGASAHRRVRSVGSWVEHGHHALMRVSAFTAVGGYDQRLSHNEDAELDVRLRRHGAQIWLSGVASVGYYPRERLWALIRQYRSYGRGRATTILEHHLIPGVRQLLLLPIAPAVALAVFSPVVPWLLLPACLWVILCIAFGLALGIRDRSVWVAGAGVPAMCMHASWSLGFWGLLVRRAAAAALSAVLRRSS
jgi:succinoglycan biosynthesis protein ExoA